MSTDDDIAIDPMNPQDQKSRQAECRKRFDECYEKIVGQAVAETIEYGEQHNFSQYFTTLLDCAILFKDSISRLESTDFPVDTVDDAVRFFDGSMKSAEMLIQSSKIEVDGFWARRKRDRRIEKEIKNMTGALKAKNDDINGKYNMALELANEVTTELQKAMNKMERKTGKQRSEKKTVKKSPTESPATRIIREIIAESVANRETQ